MELMGKMRTTLYECEIDEIICITRNEKKCKRKNMNKQKRKNKYLPICLIVLAQNGTRFMNKE